MVRNLACRRRERRTFVRGWRTSGMLVAGCLIVACSSTAGPPTDAPALGDDDATMVRPTPFATPAEEEPAGPEPGETFASPPAESIAPGARVPDVRGDEFEDAVMALRTLGMDFGTVVARPSHARLWVVLWQDPGTGTHPPADGRVSLVVSSGRAGRNMACEPERDDIDEPYCLGHLLQYY